jgi:alpha-tubulin suppressor-like RCC1 family protein
MGRWSAVSRILMAGLSVGCGRVDFDPLGDAPAPDAVVELAVGGKASCARLGSGDIWCWGSNLHGLLGASLSDPSSPVPVRVETTSATVELDINDAGGCARLAAGAVIGWGYNDRGQLGIGNQAMQSTPVLTGATDAVGLTMASGTMCIRHANGTVACTGAGVEGTLGDGSSGDRAVFGDVPGLGGVRALASGGAHVCALLDGGDVSCWGRNTSGQLGDGSMLPHPTPVAGPVGPYVEVGGGDDFTCGVRVGGGVDCWGDNTGKELGDDSGMSRATAAPVAGTAGATAIAVGAEHACALMSDRTVVCWGDNARGELGDGTFVSSATPRQVGLSEVVEISSRTDVATCARTSDGAVWCWGENVLGQIGNGMVGGDVTRPARVVGLPGT